MAEGIFTPYSTVSPFFGALPSWVSQEEQERIASYQVYDEIYHNVPQGFKLVLRGTDAKAIYLPSARIVVDTMNRYTAPRMNFHVDPQYGTPNDQTTFQVALQQLFARERFRSKFSASKKQGIRRGDWVFHVMGDTAKTQGFRLRIIPVDPASYFPVYADDDLDRLIKVHLVELFVEEGKSLIKRQTYEKTDAGILSSAAVFEATGWDTAGAKLVRQITAPFLLPPTIPAIPVYHFANREEDGNPYGSSEIRGFERLMAGMNQSISDEDLTLAMDGLGVYWTESSGPVDKDTGEDEEWIIGPARVLDNMDAPLNRLDGTKSVVPYGDHIGRLWDFMKDASGANDAAIGHVDVQVAESGVALALRMGPILSEAEDKELRITDTLTQMFYDLKYWLQAYEGVNTGDALAFPQYGDKLPRNREKEVAMVVQLTQGDAPIMSTLTGREHLAEYGFTFAPDEVQRIQQEQQLLTEARASAADPFAGRLAQEGADSGGDTASA